MCREIYISCHQLNLHTPAKPNSDSRYYRRRYLQICFRIPPKKKLYLSILVSARGGRRAHRRGLSKIFIVSGCTKYLRLQEQTLENESRV
jgi:hypothetical protein